MAAGGRVRRGPGLRTGTERLLERTGLRRATTEAEYVRLLDTGQVFLVTARVSPRSRRQLVHLGLTTPPAVALDIPPVDACDPPRRVEHSRPVAFDLGLRADDVEVTTLRVHGLDLALVLRWLHRHGVRTPSHPDGWSR